MHTIGWLRLCAAGAVLSGVLWFAYAGLAQQQIEQHTIEISSTTASITASTTQTLGQQPLTAVFNEISTVANPDDVVTAPPAVTGRPVIITNHGLNRLQIFPTSGDDLGYGVNVSTFLEENGSVTFRAHNATNWDLVSSTQGYHAEMSDTENTDAFVITSQNAGGVGEFYHTNGLAIGDMLGWNFDAGGAGSSHAIASIANAGGGDITVTTSDAHDLAVDALITHDGTSDAAYNGAFNVLTIPTTTTYTVTAAFTATDTGTMQEAATLSPRAGYGGDYQLNWWVTATSAANNQTIQFHVHVDTVKEAALEQENRFGTGADEQSLSGGGILHVEDNQKIAFMLVNLTSAGNVTLRHLTVALTKP